MFLRIAFVLSVASVLSACATDPVIDEAKSNLKSIPEESVVSDSSTECDVSSVADSIDVLTKYEYSGKWKFRQWEGDVALIFEEDSGRLFATYGGEDGTKNWIWTAEVFEPVTFKTPTEFSWRRGDRSLTLAENCRLIGTTRHSNGTSDLYFEPARFTQ